MNRKGRLTIVGIQRDEDGAESRIESAAPAEYGFRGGSHYILYEESSDSPGETTQNIIKLKDNILELTRKGAVSTRMLFEPGREHTTLYATAFGSLPLGVVTDALKSSVSEYDFQIRAEYSLTSRGRPVSRCNIFIKFEFQA